MKTIQRHVGYLIPEFPSQTHVWMWREVVHLREWGINVRLFSTRRPGERDKARHAFSKVAAAETTYLWPPRAAPLLTAILWAVFTRPICVMRCLKLAFALPVEDQPGRKRRVFPLVPVAFILAKEMKAAGITHLHCHTCASGAILAMMVKRLTGIPYSMTLNANLEWWGGGMREKLGDAQFTMVITAWLLEQVHRDYPELNKSQALLGRIGVDTKKWVASADLKRPSAGFRIATVSRLHSSKGHDILFRAVAQVVSDKRHQISLTVVGDGPERGALESLAKELKIDGLVRFTGSLGEEQVMAELQTADAFILASHSEPLGVVYMEAMALELPTVGTAAGGVAEIIRDKVTGWLVPPKDPDALATCIRWLIEHPDERRDIGIAGRRSIEEQFDSRLGAASLYQQLTGRSPETVTNAVQSVVTCES